MCVSCAGSCSEFLTLSRFFDSFGRACPSILLWCLMSQLDQIILRCTEPIPAAAAAASDSAARQTTRHQLPSDLRDFSRLMLIEQSCVLVQHIEGALMAMSGPPPVGSIAAAPSALPAASSSASAVELLLSSFGFDWRGLWLGQFAAAESGHLHSRRLCVVSPMLLAALWSLLERMPPDIKLKSIDQACSGSRGQADDEWISTAVGAV